MIQINPLKSYIDGGVRAALTTPPSASLVFDLPGKAIWVKGVKLKGTDHTYIFNHDNYITLTNTPDKNNPESEDIKIGVNITTLKNAIDTTYNGGTLALLQEGLNTEERTWLAKILHNYINNVLPTTKNLKINGTNYAIYTTENSLPLFFAPISLGTTGQILACTSSGLSWINLIQNTDYRVSLSSATSNSDYRIILKQGANNNPETDFVRFSEYLTFNPYTKILKINNIKVVTATDIYTGSTAGLVPAATSAQLNYYLRGDGAWVNIATEMAAVNTWRPIKVGNTDALGSGTNTGTLSFIAGTGITLSWDATNKRIIITNSSPDVNHNTDENVRQVPKTDNVNRPLMMINGSTSAGEQVTTSMFSTGIYANASTKMITANGFIKAGSSDNYVLLGNGGHKAESSLSVNYASSAESASSATRATNLTPENTPHYFRDPSSSSWRGGMFWGSNGNESMSFVVAHVNTRFQFVGGSDITNWTSSTWQNVTPYLTIYSSGIITPGSTTASGGFIKSGYNDNYVLLAGGGHKLISDFAAAGHTHDGRYLQYEGWWASGSGQNVDNALGMIFSYTNHGAPHHWGTTVTFEYERGSSYRLQLHGTGDNYLFFRNRSSDYGGWHSSGWKQILTNLDTYVTSDGTNRGIINGTEVASARHLLINGVTWNSDWHWSGQEGQPSWLWGSNDGVNMYVWNPSNFSVNYANSAGNADTINGYHVSNLVKFYLSPMTTDAPADSAKSWFINTMPSASGAIVYNVPGSEKTIIAGKSSGAHGHMLQLNYDDNYLRILRYHGGSWKTTDWEKISAGYADSADRANYLSGHGISPNNSHPGHGARVFYSWDIGQAGNDTSGYSNGITIGSHPGDTNYGFQIVQNMWDDRTYTRRYNGGWQSWKTLAWTSDIPTVTNYYWANIKVSASSSTGTQPTFNTCYTSNWFRSTGATGWYNESYGGGINMVDSTWVRIYNNKKFYVNNSDHDAIHSAGGVYVAGMVHAYANYLRSTCNGAYVLIGPQNSSHVHYETDATVSHWFNKRVDVNGAIWRYGSNYGIDSDGYFYAKGVYANRDGASTYGGISLYSTSDPITEYGIAFRGTGNYGKIGKVQGDWATYFTMDSSYNRGWIFRSGGINYASISARGEAYFKAVGTDNYIAYPLGGFFSSNGDSTGYIIITIPANYRSCTMMRFNVEIYNYLTGTSTTYTIGGYNYDDGNWYNVFAYANRQGTTGYGNLTVRFGHNGTNSIIWIGESNTSYSYPKVRITNVTLGHGTTDYNTWATGWSVTIATTAPTNVSQTITNPATNYYALTAGNASSVPWTGVTDQMQGGNEFNIPNSGYPYDSFWINYLPRNSRSANSTRITNYHFGNLGGGYASLNAANYYTTSDARKKLNIHKISDNIKLFEWKETGETSYGFVAQDLEVNHPELVNDNGNTKTVNYNAALSLVIAKLENRVKELEDKLGIESSSCI